MAEACRVDRILRIHPELDPLTRQGIVEVALDPVPSGARAGQFARVTFDTARIERIVVPKGAGVGSAVGFLIAPVSYEVVRSRYMKLSGFDAAQINATIEEMYEEAHAVVAQAAGDRALVESRRAYMRYAGQGYEIAVDLPEREITDGDREGFVEAFETTYRALYGRVIPGLDVEVLSWTLTLATHPAPVSRAEAVRETTVLEARTTKAMFDPEDTAMRESGGSATPCL